MQGLSTMIFLPPLEYAFLSLLRGVLESRRCKGCHNPETWDFNSGREFTDKTLDSIIRGLTANGVQRNLCIMGGEPLCPENVFLTDLIIRSVKKALPQVKIYVWTGYLYEELLERTEPHMKDILSTIDTLIDGPYIEKERDIALFMRGSKNQRIINLKNNTRGLRRSCDFYEDHCNIPKKELKELIGKSRDT